VLVGQIGDHTLGENEELVRAGADIGEELSPESPIGEVEADALEPAARLLACEPVVILTVILDDYIRQAIAAGVDTILNLGAGLDTRPYRIDLPNSLRWIEVDFPHVIELKETAPTKCRGTAARIFLPLADELRGKGVAEQRL